MSRRLLPRSPLPTSRPTSLREELEESGAKASASRRTNELGQSCEGSNLAHFEENFSGGQYLRPTACRSSAFASQDGRQRHCVELFAVEVKESEFTSEQSRTGLWSREAPAPRLEPEGRISGSGSSQSAVGQYGQSKDPSDPGSHYFPTVTFMDLPGMARDKAEAVVDVVNKALKGLLR